MRHFLYGIGPARGRRSAGLDRSVSLRCRQPSVATDTPDRRRTTGHRRTPLGVASSARSRLFARGRARDLPRRRYCLALCDVTSRMILIIPAGIAAYAGAGATAMVRRRQQPRPLS